MFPLDGVQSFSFLHNYFHFTGQAVLRGGRVGNPMPNCNHEGARHTDCCRPVPRFVEHKDGLFVRTVDTNVIVILVVKFTDLRVVN